MNILQNRDSLSSKPTAMSIVSINQSLFMIKNTGQQGWITALAATLKRNSND